MSRRRRLTLLALLAVLAAGGGSTVLAQSAPAPKAAPHGQGAPAAAPARAEPAQFAVNHGTCKQFLALAPDLRGLVVAWTAGRYHKRDRWVMDEATARKVIAGVERECEKTPDGLFRYKVVAEVEKVK